MTGFVHYRNTLDIGVASNEFFFGDPGDRFVAGDWGIVDGPDTPGLFRPSTPHPASVIPILRATQTAS